jgi:hypothetical protein
LEAEGGAADESTPKNADIREVLNYRAALNEATRQSESGASDPGAVPRARPLDR